MDNEKEVIEPIIFNEALKNRNSIYFDILGEPFAKQRPRATRKGRYMTIYTPRETKLYEEKVRKAYDQIYHGIQLDGDLSVYVEGVFATPQSVSKKKRERMLNGEIPHVKKPDCDNMAKVCLDALNGVAYPDDAQINLLHVSKRYGKTPRVSILIYENKEKENNNNGK